MKFFSLGIPAHNEGVSIARMLERVFRSRAWRKNKGKREIIVCANNCTDNTVEEVRRLQKAHPEIKLLEIEPKSKNVAWQTIVQHANPRAQNLFFADADVLVFPNAFDRLNEALAKDKRAVIAGSNPVPTAAFTRERDQYNDDYVKLRRFLRRKGRMDLDGKLYAIRRDVAITLKMPTNNHVLDDYYLSRLFRGRKIMVPEARVAYRVGGFQDLEGAHVRRVVAKHSVHELLEIQPDTYTKGRWHRIQYLMGALRAVAHLGPARAWRVYHNYLRTPTRVNVKAQAHLTNKTDAWPQIVSSKLDSRRRRPRIK